MSDVDPWIRAGVTQLKRAEAAEANNKRLRTLLRLAVEALGALNEYESVAREGTPYKVLDGGEIDRDFDHARALSTDITTALGDEG